MLCPEHWRQEAEQLSNTPGMAEAEEYGFGFDIGLVASKSLKPFSLRFGWGFFGGEGFFFLIKSITDYFVCGIFFFFMTA